MVFKFIIARSMMMERLFKALDQPKKTGSQGAVVVKEVIWCLIYVLLCA